MTTAQVLKRVSPQWAKEASRPVFRAYGRATHGSRQFPDFLIIGTKRGGTTSTIRGLQRHPSVLPMWPGVENNKKTHFFDQNFHRGPDWYLSHFPSNGQRQHSERLNGVPPVVGEAAPYYMFHPLVLGRVLETMPMVKIIVLLRNPVDRVWSHHHERVLNRTETLPFREALEAEEERLHGEADRIVAEPGYYSERHDFCSYLARGRYLEHLGPWLDAFFPHQLHVVRSEDLYSDPGATLAGMHRFLGVPPLPPENPRRYNYIPTDKMDADTRAWLADYYRPHVAALEARLGRTFGWQL